MPLRARGYAHVGSTWPGSVERGTVHGGTTASISALRSSSNADHVEMMLDQIRVQKEVHLISEKA